MIGNIEVVASAERKTIPSLIRPTKPGHAQGNKNYIIVRVRHPNSFLVDRRQKESSAPRAVKRRTPSPYFDVGSARIFFNAWRALSSRFLNHHGGGLVRKPRRLIAFAERKSRLALSACEAAPKARSSPFLFCWDHRHGFSRNRDRFGTVAEPAPGHPYVTQESHPSVRGFEMACKFAIDEHWLPVVLSP